jgi:hypothetical protein
MKFNRKYDKLLTQLTFYLIFVSNICIPFVTCSEKMKTAIPVISNSVLISHENKLLRETKSETKIFSNNDKIHDKNKNYKLTDEEILDIKYKLDVYNYTCLAIMCIVGGGVLGILVFLIISFQKEKTKLLL